MNTVISVLEGFEKLAYKFLIAIIFIPKTIVQITVNPGWVPDYINGELKQEKGPFDEYLSPVILLLVVALIPALVFTFLPVFEITMSSPAETQPTSDPQLEFSAVTSTRSSSSDIYNRYSWYVEKIIPGDTDENGFSKYQEIYRETYDEKANTTEIIRDGIVETHDGFWGTYLEYPDRTYNKSKSTFYYMFEPGADYYINIEVLNFDPRRADQPILEYYYDYRYVKVPAAGDANQQITISGTGDNRSDNRKNAGGNISDLLKKETTIFLALGLLFPPLLFAMASKLFKGEEITENTLRENFYAQCYYFSPLSLAIWATYYALYFYTPDVFFYRAHTTSQQLLLFPSILAVLWFMSTETQAIARARQTQGWKSFVIVIACTAVLGGAGYLLSLFGKDFSPIQNDLRLLTILGYPLAAGILMLLFAFGWFKRRKTVYQKIRPLDFAVIVLPLLFAVFASNIITYIMNPPDSLPVTGNEVGAVSEESAVATEPLTVEVQEQPAATELPVVATETAVPTEAAPEVSEFHTEEFGANFVADDWGAFTRGDGSAAKLVIQQQDDHVLFDLADEDLYVYYMYTPHIFDDVYIKLNAENVGRNNNNVSLICRMNADQTEWYEFSVESGGIWYLYAVRDKIYNVIGNGGTLGLKQGNEINEYGMSCQSNQITLYVNDDNLITVTDNTFKYQSGLVGFNISSLNVLPITVKVHWFDISRP